MLLENPVVGEEPIRFTRPRHKQELDERRRSEVSVGTCREAIQRDKEEWTWKAEKDGCNQARSQ